MSMLKKRHAIFWTVVLLAAIFLIGRYLVYSYKSTLRIDSREKLLELMKAESLDVKITDVKCKRESRDYTWVFVFLKKEGGLEHIDYYYDKTGGGYEDPELTDIAPGCIRALEELGIGLQQIQKHGINYGDTGVRSYTINWFQIDETYDGKSNVLLLSLAPWNVKIDVEKILAAEN